MVHVLIVGDDALTRHGLATLLAGREDVAVAGQVSPADLAAPASFPSDVVLWDAGLGPGGRIEAAEVAPIPVVAVVADEAQSSEALAAGARGVVLRDADPARLAAALVAVAAGLLVLDGPAALGPPRARPDDGVPLLEPLTPRELEVLQLLCEGLSNKRIADRLGISEHTAKFHVNAILGKLGVQSRTEALVRAARLGLVVL